MLISLPSLSQPAFTIAYAVFPAHLYIAGKEGNSRTRGSRLMAA
jgi:hypothetical protein